jgi:ABC-type cobalt transport system substrate-binding protein
MLMVSECQSAYSWDLPDGTTSDVVASRYSTKGDSRRETMAGVVQDSVLALSLSYYPWFAPIFVPPFFVLSLSLLSIRAIV